jgi:acyl-CoA thioesterase-1
MGKFLSCFILAGLALGATGCKTDQDDKAAAKLDAATAGAGDASTMEGATSADGAPMYPRNMVPPDKDPRPRVVCFGDSLTAGYGTEEGASYPDFMQRALDHDGYKYRVINEGISGETTKDGVNRLETIKKLHPQVVVVEFGGNDGLRGFDVKTTKQNLETIVKSLKSAGIKVVIAGITLPPDYGADFVSTFTATYPAVGKEFDVPVLPFLLKDVYGVDGLMQADRTHATDKGNKVVAKNVLPYVEALLKK